MHKKKIEKKLRLISKKIFEFSIVNINRNDAEYQEHWLKT